MVEGGLDNLLKDKFIQIEYIDGSITKAKFKKISNEREIGFNRWKKYWSIEDADGTILKVPETTVWRIKVMKDK